MNVLRRFEILLPSKFNTGETVPKELLAETILELREKFGAVSCETQIIQGHWKREGALYLDQLGKLFVDVPDTPENRQFFVQFKERLKTRFQQIDIWVTTHLIEEV